MRSLNKYMGKEFRREMEEAAMDSSVSPIVMNIYIEYFEE